MRWYRGDDDRVSAADLARRSPQTPSGYVTCFACGKQLPEAAAYRIGDVGYSCEACLIPPRDGGTPHRRYPGHEWDCTCSYCLYS